MLVVIFELLKARSNLIGEIDANSILRRITVNSGAATVDSGPAAVNSDMSSSLRSLGSVKTKTIV